MRTDIDVDDPPTEQTFEALGDGAAEALCVEEVEEAWSSLSRECDDDFL